MSLIVFINPPLPIQEEYVLWKNAGPQVAPLGMINLAAVTREKGYETSIIDAEALRLTIDETVNKIIESSPDYVGITSTTIFIKAASKIAEKIKQINPNIKIIIGGNHVTSLPEKTIADYSSFDVGVVGEGEVTIVELLDAFENKEDISKVDGIIYRKDGETIKTEKRELIKDLDILPLPAWDLLPELSKHYRTCAQSAKKSPSFELITSRGCYGQCTFCDRATFGNRCRAHSAEYVFKMMKELHYKYGIKSVLFEDDNFTLYRDRTMKLVELLKNADFKMHWGVCSRVDIIDPEMLKKMKEAGCWQILFGIESGSQKILDVIKKNITLNQVNEALKMTKEAGINTKGFFMMGHPTETKEDIEKTVDFITKADLDDFSCSFLIPLPGSEIYNEARKYGTFDEDLDRMSGCEPVFVPFDLTKEDLYHYSKKAFRKFYLKPRIMISYLKRLRNIGQLKLFLNAGFGFLSYILKKE